MILTGHLEEPKNFFYHYYGMVLRPFALLEFEREERVKGSIDLLITFTNPRVVGGAGDNQGNEDSSNNSDYISYKLNEATDIDALIRSSRKRRRIPTKAVRMNPSNKE
ncbi:hypothetical protein J1N35_011900 [Gossypium stocksii]|uniref:Uncharacterized protein n=1 Tax=Gossypium stocksii TaxID=47602 RepID=A0A9D4ABV8_9ROSI|nr:hypothetical protein J1N35_011900 [Gossypium stocksii]